MILKTTTFGNKTWDDFLYVGSEDLLELFISCILILDVPECLRLVVNRHVSLLLLRDRDNTYFVKQKIYLLVC